MQILHLENFILSPGKIKQKKRLNRPWIRFIFDCILFFEELVISVDRVFESLKIKRILLDPVTKIFIALALNLLILHLVLNSVLLAATLDQTESQETAITNTVQEEINLDSLKDENNNNQAKSANYLISPREKCNQSEESKKSSELCGKDQIDENSQLELKKMENAQKFSQITRTVNRAPRRLSCPESNYGNPSKSQTKGKHMDEDCCPDPDEWPKPGCVYDAHGYSIMMSRPR